MDKKGGRQFLDPEYIFSEVGLKEGQTLADLGCGALGHFTFPAAKVVGNGGKVYSVDIRRIILAGIKNRARIDGFNNIETIWANLEILKSTGIANDGVDLATLFNVLFQSDKQGQILAEAIRIVKPGGSLAIIDWKNNKTSFGPPSESRVKPEEIKKICLNQGLSLEKEFEASDYHFGLLFKKLNK